MDNNRMSTADMLQYCDEALAWEDFGPIDRFFFQSVKKILLGQCSALEEPEEVINDLLGIERPVSDTELEPDYDKYADIYYGEEGDDDIPDYSCSKADEAFDSVIKDEGFFDEESQEENDGNTAAETAPEAAPAVVADSIEEAIAMMSGSSEKAAPAEEDSEGADTKAKSAEKHEETEGGGFTVNL